MKQKFNTITWIYIMFLCCFSEVLGLFVPKMILRIVYILAMFIIIFWNGKITIRKNDFLILVYIAVLSVRFSIQILLGDVSSATNLSFFQTVIPIFAYFISTKLDDDQAQKIESWYCIFCTVSVFMGFMNEVVHFLPSAGAFAGGLYASVGNTVVQRGYSMAGSALNTGFMCLIAIPFLIQKLNSHKNILTIIMLIVTIIGCLYSYSRGAIAALIIISAIYVWNKYKQGNRKISKNTMLFIILVAIVFLGIVVLKYDSITQSSIFMRFSQMFSLSEASNAKRTGFLTSALSSYSEVFLFGKGFGFTGYQAAVQRVYGMINTESYILTIGINVGILGILLFCAIIFKSIRKRGVWLIQYTSIICGLFAWSIVYILLDSDITALVFWYIIGRIWSSNTDSGNIKTQEIYI